jgi:predicted nuclease of predicted toxin-antitoxin system
VKILLDECVHVQVRNALTEHEVSTVQMQGWKGIKNGELLAVAEAAGFCLFILADKNLRHQQNLTGRRLAILELWTNHRPTLENHFPLIRAAAESIQPGEYRALESP